MSITTKCDVCSRTEPEVNCRYSREKRFGWFKYNYDSSGGSHTPLDLCEECWEGFKDYQKKKVWEATK